MNEKNKFVKAIKHPEWLFGVILRRLFAKVLDDKSFINGTGDRYEDKLKIKN